MTALVLNERDAAEQAIQNHQLGQKASTTLLRVARYYYTEGYKKAEIRPMLEDFLLKCNPSINLVKWSQTIAWAVKSIERYRLLEIEYIPITQKELDACAAMPTHQTQRILFSLICVAKYGNLVNEKNGNWVNRPDNEVFGMANVTLGTYKQSCVLHDMMQAGLIKFSQKVDNVNINVCCVDDDPNAEVVLKITDFRNLGYQFERCMGGKYFECMECGLVVPKRSNAQKYCKDCGRDMNRRKTLERYVRMK